MKMSPLGDVRVPYARRALMRRQWRLQRYWCGTRYQNAIRNAARAKAAAATVAAATSQGCVALGCCIAFAKASRSGENTSYISSHIAHRPMYYRYSCLLASCSVCGASTRPWTNTLVEAWNRYSPDVRIPSQNHGQVFAHGRIPSHRHWESIRRWANTLSATWAGIRPWTSRAYSTKGCREYSSIIIECTQYFTFFF